MANPVSSPSYVSGTPCFDGADLLTLSTGEITLLTSTAVSGISFMVPWACTIQRLYIYTRVAASSASDGVQFTLGTKATTSIMAYITGLSCSTAATMNIIEGTNTTIFTGSQGNSVLAGDSLVFTCLSGQAGLLAGVLAASVVVNPNM